MDEDGYTNDYYASSIDKLEGSQAHVESIKSKNSKYTQNQTIITEGNKFSAKRYDTDQLTPEIVGKSQTMEVSKEGPMAPEGNE